MLSLVLKLGHGRVFKKAILASISEKANFLEVARSVEIYSGLLIDSKSSSSIERKMSWFSISVTKMRATGT